jgi:peptidoglycan hydrolase-like protein with peptidoglycan-binding domain
MPISNTVGAGGANEVDDVIRVQSLLNEFRSRNGRALIGVDGKVGAETIGAIRDFQQAVTHVVDGRIDPDGPAITALEELIAPKVFEAAVLAMIAVVSEYDPRVESIQSDRTVSQVVRSLRGDRVG